MAKLRIFKFPDVVLAQKAAPVPRVDKTYYRTVDDMLETMYYAVGIGLAANQVGLLERMIVIDTNYDATDPDDEDEDAEGAPAKGATPPPPEGAEVNSRGGIITGKKPIILFNPDIIYREGKFKYNEGCLSVPEYNAEVERSEKIKVQYQDVDGLTKTLDADGVFAVCIQHEIDHLDGRLFIERLSPMKKEMAKKRLLKERKAREAEMEEEMIRKGKF